MFKGHPKGLYVAFLANMGERFGFYTMMAILVLFLQARFALPANEAGGIYSNFYFMVYALTLLGGFIADRTRKFKLTIFVGQAVMFAGYVFLAMPDMSLNMTIGALMIIALGNGLFKGNLQAVVGQLYDDPKYRPLRDRAFSIFYMGINIGSLFAPAAASGIRNWYLKLNGLGYNGNLPYFSNQLLADKPVDLTEFQSLADQAAGTHVTDLTAFAQNYVDVFSTGYNCAFGIAAGAMVVSMLIYALFQKHLPGTSLKTAETKEEKTGRKEAAKMPWSEEKPRLIALGLVFVVVIFFWMAFHQNGLTLTMFANEYTQLEMGRNMYLVFNIGSVLCLAAVLYGIITLVRKGTSRNKLWGAMLACAGLIGAFFFWTSFSDKNTISPEIFQQFNPLFVVLLTPVTVGLFTWLADRGKEPSSPRKIGIGMIITTIAFTGMAIVSIGLPSPASLGGGIVDASDKVSPGILVGTYFMLTIAELFLSPMGISFVSKVSPPRFQGLMQGCWFGATAIGNKLTAIGSWMYVRFEMWQVWALFVVCCLIAATFIFSIMRRLEKATSGS